MKYHQKVFEQLEPIAIKANAGHARLAAAVVYKHRVYSIGVNSKKSHPFQKKYGRNVNSIFLHAETSAIHQALRYFGNPDDLADADLYVLRMKKDGPNATFHYGLARPCSGCQQCIAEFGIRNVFYTTDDGDIDYL